MLHGTGPGVQVRPLWCGRIGVFVINSDKYISISEVISEKELKSDMMLSEDESISISLSFLQNISFKFMQGRSLFSLLYVYVPQPQPTE